MNQTANASWTVWVGGSEMNTNLLTYEQANELAGYWIGNGYKDVAIQNTSEGSK